MQCEAVLLGREQVAGAVDTSSLANLIRSLLPPTGRRVWTSSVEERFTLRCHNGLEFIKRLKQSKRHDDEGFESDGDDDSASTRSLSSSADDTISNSSSCCFVDDHVFKCHPTSAATTGGRTTIAARVPSSSTSSCVSSVATDSANSSGASDTEDTSAPPTPSPTAVSTTSVSALVKSLSLFQQRNSSNVVPKPPAAATTTIATANKEDQDEGKETYAISEVAFCHTDPAFPRVVVWVVKKRRSQRLSPSGTDTSSGLEAVVFECSNEENMKKLCESFQETSRRVKLEQYRHPHRRKDTSPAPNRTNNLTPESIIKALKDATEKSSAATTVTVTSSKPIIKPKPVHLPTSRTSSANSSSGPGSEVEVLSTVAGTRFNLVQRTDGDGVTHIEVSRGLPMENPVENVISLEEDQETGGPSSIISISTPDVGNLLSANNSSKSRFCKEIEGVIRSDVDSTSGARKEVMQRQRQPAILVIHSGNGEDDSGELRKVWSPPASSTPPQVVTEDAEDNTNSSEPPQRPERKRFTRRVKPPAPQPPTTKNQNQSEPSKKQPLCKTQVDVNTSVVPHKRASTPSSINNQQMVVRGQFIRVSVDQQQPQPTMVVPVIQQGGWLYGNAATTGNLVAYSPAPANWGIPLTTTLKSATNKNQIKNKTHPKRKEAEDAFNNSSATVHQLQQQQHYQKNRSRNNINSNYRSKSPPARRPMAYRYIDTVPTSNTANTLSNRFFGLSQKLREIGGSVVNSTTSNAPFHETHRRRNSLGELPARFEYFGESLVGGGSEGKNGGNLKSVIKKNRRLGEYTEPKKVTFSAYATVQVVD